MRADVAQLQRDQRVPAAAKATGSLLQVYCCKVCAHPYTHTPLGLKPARLAEYFG